MLVKLLWVPRSTKVEKNSYKTQLSLQYIILQIEFLDMLVTQVTCPLPPDSNAPPFSDWTRFFEVKKKKTMDLKQEGYQQRQIMWNHYTRD